MLLSELTMFENYEELPAHKLIWCNTHQRRATHCHKYTLTHCCNPALGGIMLPCSCVNLTGLALIEADTKQSQAKLDGIR